MKYMLLLDVVSRTTISIGGVVTLNKRWISSALMGALALITVGCSHSQSSKNHTPPHSNNVTQPQVKIAKKPLDGALASIQQIKTSESYTGTNIKVYKLLYWSKGYKVEALLTEPTKPGKYPLLLDLHGGAGWRVANSHVLGWTANLAAYQSNSHTVMLYPEYQGYMASQGLVMGIWTDLADITNAITAAKSLGEVKANDTYVIGYSLGGGLALMTAAQDREVRAVVAVSPFVGLNDFVSWANQHAKPGSVSLAQLQLINASYGDKVDSNKFNKRSPDVKRITAPVLLLQGTADQHVAWQTVRTFANQMKAAHKSVKLVLYPGGHHGLKTGVYQSESTQQINNWFAKYGLHVQL